MARRRSASRRSLRRSLNATELDRDSDRFDTNNPMWWKNMEGDMTMRPSLPVSTAETTGSILDLDWSINPADLQDRWWDHLDRTKLGSSRRFSSRKSLNTGDTYQESFNSDGTDDISIKKRKVMLRPRANKSGGTDNFQRVLNESDATAQSEPLPGKRKSKSPMRSDTEIARKKTRTSRSHAAESSRHDRDNDSLTSNDSDVIVKPRPKAFKKRFTSQVRASAIGNVLQNDEAGPSGINTSKGASRMNDSPLSKISANVTPEIDSNESGLMGPPKSGSLRKRLSSIARKLNLTSDESGSDGASKKPRAGFAKKARKKLSVNPFDEILSGHVEKENSQSGSQTNASAADTKMPGKSRGSRGVDRTASSIAHGDQTSTMEKVPMNDSNSKTRIPEVLQSQRNSTVDFDTPSGEENSMENNHRSIPATNEISNVSNTRPHSKERNTLSRQSVLAEDSRNQLVQDWESSGSEDEALVDRLSKSMSNVSKGSTSTKKSFVVSKTLLSSTRISLSHRIDESVRESDAEEETAKDEKASLKSASHSRIIVDSAYELPDKERSDSPIISLSENEDDKSVDDSKRNKLEKSSTRQSADRSIRREPSQSNVSRKSSSRANNSKQKINSDESISEEEILGGGAETTKGGGGKLKSSSDEDAQRKISKSVNLSAKGEVSTSRKSAPRASVSRERMESEEENDHDGENSNSKLANFELPFSYENEDARSVDDSKRNKLEKSSTRQSADRSIRREPSQSNVSRKSSSRSNNSKQKINSDESISEEEILGGGAETTKGGGGKLKSSSDEDAQRKISKSVNLSAKGNVSPSRKSAPRASVSRERMESEEENDHDGENSNSKLPNLYVKRKSSTPGRNTSRGNVSGRLTESDESEDEVEDSQKSKPLIAKQRNKSTRLSKNSSITQDSTSIQHSEKTDRRSTKRDSRSDERASTSRKSFTRASTSGRQTMLDDIISEEEAEEVKNNSKSASFSAMEKTGTARKSTSYGNTSRKIFVPEEITNDEEAEDVEKSTSKSTKRSLPADASSSRNRVESGESISEEEERPEDAARLNSKSTRSSLRAEGRNTNAARNSFSPPVISGQGRIESDDAVDAANSKSANLAAKRKSSEARNSSANVSAQRGESAESLSEEDKSGGDKANSKPTNISAKREASAARESNPRGNVSERGVASVETSSEEDAERNNSKAVNISAEGKVNTSHGSAARGNVSERRVESDESSGEDENAQGNISKSVNLSAKGKVSTSRKSAARGNVSREGKESDESEEEVEDSQKPKPLNAKEVNKSTPLPKNTLITQDTTDAKKSTLSTAVNSEDEDSTADSEVIPPNPELTTLPNNRSVSVLGKSNVSRTQKNITDFFQSKFTHRSDNSRTLDLTSFDHEKLKLVREEMEKIKQQEIKAMRIDVTAKKKETRRLDNAPKAKQSRSKENNLPKVATKPAKVVDKAFIVNGTVYKRPKLPRPKPWVTDRLYNHLWKKMEPKFDLSTRIKSEKFVVQLAEVVAVTIRRKKYDSYKLELEALMKEMAKLGIIKTRNDFYDFCYDFMPYDFRIKATPILMPGNVRNIPYDPEKLHKPILAEASRSG